MEIKLQYRKEFGKERFYAANELAGKLLSLIKRRSFTQIQVNLLKEAGFTLNIVSETPKFG